MTTPTTQSSPANPSAPATAHPNVSAKAESALPTVATMPSRLPGERPTTGIPFSRLTRVELRKQLDTRAGRWLIIAIGLVIATALAINFFTNGGQHSFEDYLSATMLPTAIILPVIGILAVTSEWSQRTGLVTFALEPRRTRVAMAKLVSAVLIGIAAFVLAFALAALVHQAAITFRGINGDWSVGGLVVLGAGLYVLLGLMQGVAFGALFRNTPAAIVVYFVLPTVWGILGGLISWLDTPSQWLDMNRTMQPLFSGSMSGEQWAQLGTSVAVWIVVPLVVGILLLRRAEVK
ncbi:MAG: ABC transporter permease [Humibacillus sp.]|nr:ABC transporter permease [Humibacillus sp.]MDN5779945.1 ABC transporter permease [Humibacillus sp.]